MTLTEYWQALNTHDWYHCMSDDDRMYRAGMKAEDQLETIANKAVEIGDTTYLEMFNAFRDYMFPKIAADDKEWQPEKPAKPLSEAEKAVLENDRMERLMGRRLPEG